jgi:hypothetical protein
LVVLHLPIATAAKAQAGFISVALVAYFSSPAIAVKTDDSAIASAIYAAAASTGLAIWTFHFSLPVTVIAFNPAGITGNQPATADDHD